MLCYALMDHQTMVDGRPRPPPPASHYNSGMGDGQNSGRICLC